MTESEEHPLEQALRVYQRKVRLAYAVVRLLDRGLREAELEGAAPKEDALLAKALTRFHDERLAEDEAEITH